MTKAKPVFDHSPDGTVTFSLTLPVELIKKEYQHVLQEMQKTTEIKGFRKGYAPLELVEAKSDPSRLYSHVLEHALPPAYSRFIQDNSISPLIDPQVVPQKMTLDQDWVMQIKVAVTPQFELGEYQQAVKKALTEHEKGHKHEKPQTKEDAGKHKDHLLEIVFEALLAHVKLSVSPLLIDEEAKSALSRLASQLSSLKLSVVDYAKSIKKSEAELVAEYKKSAEANLKLEFILQKLIEKLAPVISDEDVKALNPAQGREAYAKYVLQKRAVLDKLCEL